LLADQIVFAVASLLVVASALMVVINRHPVHSALYLVLTFLGLSVFFLQLQAPFLAAVQVIVYAGAIMVLFLFVIMLLGEDKPLTGGNKLGVQKWLGPVFALVIAGQIGYLLMRGAGTGGAGASGEQAPYVRIIGGETVSFGSVKALGSNLFTNYVFAFEATSVVLLVAMIGVVVLAKKRL
jgi:NADH-quinone oxidoreductase subunit J